MNFLQAIKTCYIDKGTTFSGRASRSEFWWFVLFYCTIAVTVSFLHSMSSGIIKDAFIGIIYFTFFFFILPLISVIVRRFHDTGHSGFLALFLFLLPKALEFIFCALLFNFETALKYFQDNNVTLPHLNAHSLGLSSGMAGFVFLLMFICLLTPVVLLLKVFIEKGTPGPNRFGEDPLQNNSESPLIEG
jgi:uncharacterized membrane protein YhaH (DUF805 family)